MRRLAVLVLTLSSAGLAWAQTPPVTGAGGGSSTAGSPAESPEDPARMTQARERFQSGMSHYDAHRYRDAIHDFELAASLVPSADIAYNIARCYEQLQEYDPAIQYYERYLREKVEPPDRPQVEAKLTELRALRELARQNRRQRVGWGLVRVTSRTSGAHIRIDDGPARSEPVTEPVRVGAASRLVADRPGMQHFVARVGARPGEIGTAVVQLRPATRYETAPGGRLWTYVAGGLAVATAGFGVAFGVQALGRSGDAADAAPDRQLRLYGEAGDLANNADLCFGAALLSGVATLVLYFVEGSSSETRTLPASSSSP